MRGLPGLPSRFWESSWFVIGEGAPRRSREGAQGPQVVHRPAARALDGDLFKHGLCEFSAAVATTYFFHGVGIA